MAALAQIKNKWAQMQLQSKLITAFILVALLGILVLTTAVSISTKVLFNNYLYEMNSTRLVQMKGLFEEYYLGNNSSWQGVENLVNQPALLRSNKGRTHDRDKGMQERIIIQDAKGRTVADSGVDILMSHTESSLARQQTVKLTGEKDQVIGELVFSSNPPPGVMPLEDSFSQSVVIATCLGGLVATLLAIILAVLFSRRLSIPLVSLTQAAQRLGEKDYKQRLSVTGKDEIGMLAQAFNTMAEALEQNEQVRNSLVADVAHELRTPVTVLRGNLECLQAGVLEATPQVISSLHDEVLRLSRLINELQELSLAEAGKLPLHLKQISGSQLLQKVVNNFRAAALAKNIDLKLDLSAGDYQLELDEDRIVQVLANIINNALRHTPEGQKIIVALTPEDMVPGHENWVCISVTDSGSGIDEEERKHIFDRFYRGSKSRNRADGGAGLGLAIAKGLVEAHGGKIIAEPAPVGGSRFRVCMPKENCAKGNGYGKDCGQTTGEGYQKV